MSAFNILISEIQCPQCGKFYNGRIQFKFGDTWQFEYKLGDKIKWGGNDIGKPNIKKVKVYGILESSKCPFCQFEDNQNEFDIIVENDIIKNIRLMSDINSYNNGEYKICTE
jgi:sarcosine oxidase delta subunit